MASGSCCNPSQNFVCGASPGAAPVLVLDFVRAQLGASGIVLASEVAELQLLLSEWQVRLLATDKPCTRQA